MPQVANNELATGFTHYIRVTAADLTTSGYLTSSERLVASVPSGGIVTNAAVILKTALAGASDITISVGITSGTATNLIASTDLDALTKVAYNTGSAVDTEPGYVNNSASAVPIYARFGGTVSSLTAGEFIVALTILDAGALFD